MSAIMKVPLVRVKTDPRLQMRPGDLDQRRVDYYAEMVNDGREPPPIVLVLADDGADYWLVDGHYRVAALKKVGRAVVAADIIPGGFQHALWLASGANADHGLERDAAALQRAVRTALGCNWAWSDRRLAAHVGCSASTVLRARAALEGEGRQPEGSRVGVDGRTRRLPTPAGDGDRDAEAVPEHVAQAIEASLERKPDLSDETVAERHSVLPAVVAGIRERLAAEEEERSRGPDGVDADPGDGADEPHPDDDIDDDNDSTASMTQLKQGKSKQLCSVGLVIPDALVPLWNAVWERGDALLAAIKAASLLVSEVAQMPGGEAYAYALEHRAVGPSGAQEVKFTSAHLKSASMTLLGNLPFASVCPECVRMRSHRSHRDCGVCRGRGWLPRSVWENFREHQRTASVEWVRDREGRVGP